MKHVSQRACKRFFIRGSDFVLQQIMDLLLTLYITGIESITVLNIPLLYSGRIK